MNTLKTLLIFCLVLHPLPVFAQSGAKMTRLRASTPEGTFRTVGGATRLTNISVRVKNVGEERAEGVQVQITLPNGASVTASGPNEIEANSEAGYTYYHGEYVTSSKALKAQVSCQNCHR